MEESPHVDPGESLAAQPDYMEEYAHTTVTAFGMTGELEKLRGICPVDLDDPNISLKTKNEVTAKLLNESSAEIAAKHAGDFRRILREAGLEPNFTVAPSERGKGASHENKGASDQSKRRSESKPPKSADSKNTPMSPRTDESRPLSRQTATETLRQTINSAARMVESEQMINAEATSQVKTEQLQKNLGSMSVATELSPEPSRRKKSMKNQSAATRANSTKAETHTGTAVKDSKPAARSHTHPAHKSPKQATLRGGPKHVGAREHHRAQHEAKPADKKTESAVAARAKKVRDAALVEPIAAVAASRLTDDSVELASETAEQTAAWQPEAAGRRPAAEQESLRFFDDFTEGLQALVAAAELLPVDDSNEQAGLAGAEQPAGRPTESTPQLESIPAIMPAIAKRLETLEPDQKVIVASTLESMAETAHSIAAAGEMPANQQKSAETAARQLAEQATILFEQLGIDYKPADIDQFVKVLPRLNLQPRTTARATAPKQLNELPREIATADLEHDGTREAKWRLSHLAVSLRDTERAAERLLGKLALLYTAGNDQSRQAMSVLRKVSDRRYADRAFDAKLPGRY